MKEMKKPKNAIAKILVIIREVSNWYLIVKDKLFGGKNILYKFRNGAIIECRTKSTDINEAIVVLSGIEYPRDFCKIDTESSACIIDIGSNIGTFSIYVNNINKNKNMNIYAFEPHPENAQLAMRNLQRNKVSNFQVIEKAVSDKDGTVIFDISGPVDSFRINEKSDSSIKVDSVKLSSFCKNMNICKIDLLKMDIEGSEYNIFSSDIEFIKNNIEKILVEYHNIDMENGAEFISQILSPEYEISVQNAHKGGGILLASKK